MHTSLSLYFSYLSQCTLSLWLHSTHSLSHNIYSLHSPAISLQSMHTLALFSLFIHTFAITLLLHSTHSLYFSAQTPTLCTHWTLSKHTLSISLRKLPLSITAHSPLYHSTHSLSLSLYTHTHTVSLSLLHFRFFIFAVAVRVFAFFDYNVNNTDFSGCPWHKLFCFMLLTKR